MLRIPCLGGQDRERGSTWHSLGCFKCKRSTTKGTNGRRASSGSPAGDHNHNRVARISTGTYLLIFEHIEYELLGRRIEILGRPWERARRNHGPHSRLSALWCKAQPQGISNIERARLEMRSYRAEHNLTSGSPTVSLPHLGVAVLSAQDFRGCLAWLGSQDMSC